MMFEKEYVMLYIHSTNSKIFIPDKQKELSP